MSHRAVVVLACLAVIAPLTMGTSTGHLATRRGPVSATPPSRGHRVAARPPSPSASAATAPVGILPESSASPSGRAAPSSQAPSPLAPPPPPSSPSAGGPTPPIRAAFFYPWYPESWYPTSHFTPTLGAPYDSSSQAVINYQIAAMEYANIDVGIASWWGPGTPTDSRIPLLLAAAAGTHLKWTLYYEPAPGTQASDLAYIYSRYATSPTYERVDGKPVLFIYSRSVASCADAANWVSVNAGRFYLDLQVFSGYRSCPIQPDQWHQYAPAERQDEQVGHSFSVSPGFWLYSSSTPLLARDPVAFAQAVREMVASGEPWQLITTWNEWGEGTAVEDAVQWQSSDPYGQYVDILHTNP